ncbi:putative reverse transcriptase domain-containing protein, partial [Tanacetum coccineum]
LPRYQLFIFSLHKHTLINPNNLSLLNPTKQFLPIKLDLEDWNYGSWEFFFDQLCDSYDVSKFIHGIPSGTSTSDHPPFNPDELKVDKIILSWIFSTPYPETVRAYAAAPVGGKIYAGNLPKCNRCNLHHHGPCPQKCQRCQRICHMEKDCRVRLQGAGNDFLHNVTCFGCGEKGHFKDKCPKAGNQQNDGARGRAYVVIENP